MNKISKIFDIKVFLYAFAIWFSLNISGIQNMYFTGAITLTTIAIKIVHLVFLYIILKKIKSLFINRKIPKVKNEIIISLIYFSILTILLLLVWPGAWSNDDITILKNAEIYDLTPWHHFFSGLFQILCLQTIPIPAGIIIIQILISSLIIGYCISNIATLYGKNQKQTRIIQIVLGLISLFPPVILYILSGFRMGIYSYLELLLITKMIILFKENKEIEFSELLKISFLTILVSCWRTEGLYYPIFILIMYLILGKKVISKKVAITAFFIVMIINFSIGKINNAMIGTNNYSITATIQAVTSLVENSNETDKEELEIINKVVDVEFIKENPNIASEDVFWAEDVIKDYTDEEYTDYLKAYIKLALKYPDVAFKSMWDFFAKSGSGVGERSKQTMYNMVHNGYSTALEIYKINAQGWKEWREVRASASSFNNAINEDVREKVILFLNGSQENKELTLVHNIFWNLFIPFILILICLIYKLTKKDWFVVILILTVIARIPLVFATAPAPYFMYYLSTYLCSYFISAIVIFEMITNMQEKNEKKLFKGRTFLYTFLIWLNLNILGMQKMFFSEDKNATTIIIKILHFVFLYIIIDKIHSLYKQRHTPKVKNEIIISLICFLILISMMILVWPGAWSENDITILKDASNYEFTTGEHFFTGTFQMLCLQTIPIPAGVMIIQILIASLILGHCITNISLLYGKNKKQITIIQTALGLIAIFPPLIRYILSGFRMGIYSYLELALITQLLILYKEKKEVTFNNIFKISFLTVIISCWRPDALYYPFLILFLYFILGKKIVRKKVAIIAFLIVLLINCLIGTINYLIIGNDDNIVNTETETLDLYTVNTNTWVKWNSVTSKAAKYKTPLDIDTRKNVILFLNEKNILWNLYIPLALILLSLIYKVIKKDWFIVTLILTIMARIPIVLATITENSFIYYYLSVYLCSYVISFIVFFEIINNFINKRTKNNDDKTELVVYKGIFKQFLSFLLVSGVGWLMDFSIYFALTHFANFKVVFANILSSIPAITYVFLMSNKKIFKNTDSKLSLRIKYLIYFGYQLLLLLSISLLGEFLYDNLINLVTIEFLINNLKIFIKIFITPITMTLNFIVMKNLIEKL